MSYVYRLMIAATLLVVAALTAQRCVLARVEELTAEARERGLSYERCAAAHARRQPAIIEAAALEELYYAHRAQALEEAVADYVSGRAAAVESGNVCWYCKRPHPWMSCAHRAR